MQGVNAYQHSETEIDPPVNGLNALVGHTPDLMQNS